jgi:putative membrane protein
MFSSLTTVAAHPVGWGWGWGWGPGPWFLLFPLFWLGVIALFFTIGARRRRQYWSEGGWGPQRGASGARGVLAERFARGEIDEAEYRARLEVLLATGPQPPS